MALDIAGFEAQLLHIRCQLKRIDEIMGVEW